VTTRGHADIRGLVTAGRAVRLERNRWSKSERSHHVDHGMVVHSLGADRSSRGN
jgi:hypothetical protein